MPDFVDSVFDLSDSIFKSSLSVLDSSYHNILDLSSKLSNSISNHDLNNYSPITTSSNTTTKSSSSLIYKYAYSLYDYSIRNKWKSVSAISISLYIYHLYYNNNKYQISRQKRRANKLINGKRFEVILIIGSPLNPLVQRLVHDLNKRGFIIYITVINELELNHIENEKDDDIKPLIMNYTSDITVNDSLLQLGKILDTPILDKSYSSTNQTSNSYYYLNFKACLIIPDYNKISKNGFEEISSIEFQRLINDKFLNYFKILNNGLIKILRESNKRKSKIEKFNNIKFNNNRQLIRNSKLIFINYCPSSQPSLANSSYYETLKTLKNLNELLFNYIYNENNKFKFKLLNSITLGWIYSNVLKFNLIKLLNLLKLSSFLPQISLANNENLIDLSLVNLNNGKNLKISSSILNHSIFDLIYSNNLHKSYNI
ncbi:hypothetical protein B5S30_g3313 [[Candida] boidinii]|nr:hypothetical protein B5S30_g3313 [[Candida] boidinii]